jgi:glycosyltransferase involved in cell wall biosynthesis
VAAFTGSRTVSSARFRVRQYVGALAQQGIDLDELISRFGSWPPRAPTLRPAWFLGALAERLIPILGSRRSDLVLFQRELISTFFTLERFAGRPRVLDLDDAVWLNGRRAQRSFDALVQACDGVICGNAFLAEHVSRLNGTVIVIPTAVDTERFRPASSPEPRRTVGWSGLQSGYRYLLAIEDALARVLAARPDAVLRIVSDARPVLRRIPAERVEFVPWSPDVEVSTIQSMSVGLMPIDETPWSLGKCSYKMLLYMACGVPVVVSPFGMNGEVLSRGDVGHAAASESEWVDAIVGLLDEPERRQRLGATGRRVVEEHYSVSAHAPRLGAFLRGVAK